MARRWPGIVGSALAALWCGSVANIARAECGDGIVDPDESCDLGVGNETGVVCTSRCAPPSCGDGHLDVDEACDDGNAIEGDGCNAQCIDEASPVWSTTVDLAAREASDGEMFAALAATPEGYVAVGRFWREVAERGAPVESFPFVVAFDGSGAVRWLDAPSSSPGNGYASEIVVRDDDEIWVAGVAVDDDGVQRPTLWRYDGSGVLAASIALDQLDGAGTVDALVVDARGRVFAGGAHAPPGIPETGWIGELDLDAGALVWWVDTADRHRVADIAPMHDGRLAATGSRANVLWAGVFDDTGVRAWAQELYNDYPTQTRSANAVAVAADDTLYVAGRSEAYVTNDLDDANGWLGAFSSEGEVLWTKDVVGAGLAEDFRDVSLVDDEPVATGRVGTSPLVASASSDVDVWVAAFDATGEPKWEWRYDGAMHHVDAGGATLVEPDGGLTVVGSTTVPFAHADAWIGRVRAGATSPSEVAPAPIVAHAVADRPARARVEGPSATTLFLDFDGGTLRQGTRGDLGQLPCLAGAAPYPGLAIDRQAAQAIVDRVAMVMDPYGVHVRWDEPLPPHLPRTTVMMGGEAGQFGLDASVTGYSCVVDCANAWAWDLAFAFDGPAASVANTAAHEAGHTWGLDHVVDMAHLMYPLSASLTADWGDDACIASSARTSAVLCGDTHGQWCDDGEQNSHAELLAAFGPDGPDVSPPEVSLSVVDDRLDEGEPAEIEVAYTDDRGLPGLRLQIPELAWERVVADGETSFALPLPAGEYTIVAEAIDHAEQRATASVVVVVGDDEPSADVGSSGDAPDDGTGTSTTTEGSSSSGDAAQGDASGCGCRASPRAASWWALTALLAWRRTRSRRL